ncbi:hypothetical protein KFU94_71065 [Chloroflexi bacterium TSY]|nr:hypothetical protein [Chloroflexi bacterium TSY]
MPKETRVWTSSPQTYLPASSGRGRKASKLRVRPGEPTPLTVAQLADTFQEHEWQQHVLKEGSKGFIVASIACRRIVSVRNGLPVLLSGSSSAAIPIALCNFSPMHPLRLPWMTSPLFLLCVGPLKPFLNKPSSFSDSTNMKLAVGSVGIII